MISIALCCSCAFAFAIFCFVYVALIEWGVCCEILLWQSGHVILEVHNKKEGIDEYAST